MRTCNCPNCNANLTIDDENRDFAFANIVVSRLCLMTTVVHIE